MAETVQGQFTGDYSVTRGGFTYWYTCKKCNQRFLETAPELSAPAMCNECYTGQHALTNKRWYDKQRKRKAVKTQE